MSQGQACLAAASTDAQRQACLAQMRSAGAVPTHAGAPGGLVSEPASARGGRTSFSSGSSGSSPKALVALCGGAGLAGMAMAVWWKRRHAADVSEAPPAGAASDGPALL